MRGDNILVTDSGGAVLGGFGLTKVSLIVLTGPVCVCVVLTEVEMENRHYRGALKTGAGTFCQLL